MPYKIEITKNAYLKVELIWSKYSSSVVSEPLSSIKSFAFHFVCTVIISRHFHTSVLCVRVLVERHFCACSEYSQDLQASCPSVAPSEGDIITIIKAVTTGSLSCAPSLSFSMFCCLSFVKIKKDLGRITSYVCVCVCVCVLKQKQLLQMKCSSKYKRTEKERVTFSHWPYGRFVQTLRHLLVPDTFLSCSHDQKHSFELPHTFALLCVELFNILCVL
jgi:hypothetical protein